MSTPNETPEKNEPAPPSEPAPFPAGDPARLMGLGLPSEAGGNPSVSPDDCATLEAGPSVGAAPAAGGGSAGHFVPPSVDELAGLFPQFQMVELLGHGGMGAVYKARQAVLDRFVAVKILPPQVSRSPGFAQRFMREARALAKLSHPNIVAVHDFGKVNGPHGDLYFIVMEYIDGTNLRQLIRSGAATPSEALAIVPQVCEALQFAHDEGIVHRDIKPENILIDKKGRVRIADFGLAKLAPGTGEAGHDVHTLTHTGGTMGTPRYMAPEQMEGAHDVDHRADIYSLGVVFYEMLTGEVPMGRFAAPSKRVQVDVRLDEIVLRTLEREPEQRYQQVSEVKTQVEHVSRTPVSAPRSPGTTPFVGTGPHLALCLLLSIFTLWFLLAAGGPFLTMVTGPDLALIELGKAWGLGASVSAIFPKLAAFTALLAVGNYFAWRGYRRGRARTMERTAEPVSTGNQGTHPAPVGKPRAGVAEFAAVMLGLALVVSILLFMFTGRTAAPPAVYATIQGETGPDTSGLDQGLARYRVTGPAEHKLVTWVEYYVKGEKRKLREFRQTFWRIPRPGEGISELVDLRLQDGHKLSPDGKGKLRWDWCGTGGWMPSPFVEMGTVSWSGPEDRRWSLAPGEDAILWAMKGGKGNWSSSLHWGSPATGIMAEAKDADAFLVLKARIEPVTEAERQRFREGGGLGFADEAYVPPVAGGPTAKETITLEGEEHLPFPSLYVKVGETVKLSQRVIRYKTPFASPPYLTYEQGRDDGYMVTNERADSFTLQRMTPERFVVQVEANGEIMLQTGPDAGPTESLKFKWKAEARKAGAAPTSAYPAPDKAADLAVYHDVHSASVNVVAVTPDGRSIVSCDAAGKIVCLDIAGGTRFQAEDLAASKAPATAWLSSLAISPTGTDLYAGGHWKVLHIAMGKTPSAPRKLLSATEVVHLLVPYDGGNKLACLDSQELVFHDLKANAVLARVPIRAEKSTGSVRAAAASPDGGHIAACFSDKDVAGPGAQKLTVYNVAKSGAVELAWNLPENDDSWYARVVFPDSRTLALCLPRGEIRRWTLDDAGMWKAEGEVWSINPGRYRAMAASRDGKLIYLAEGKQVVALDAKTGKQVASANLQVGPQRGNSVSAEINSIAATDQPDRVVAGLWDGRVALVSLTP